MAYPSYRTPCRSLLRHHLHLSHNFVTRGGAGGNVTKKIIYDAKKSTPAQPLLEHTSILYIPPRLPSLPRRRLQLSDNFARFRKDPNKKIVKKVIYSFNQSIHQSTNPAQSSSSTHPRTEYPPAANASPEHIRRFLDSGKIQQKRENDTYCINQTSPSLSWGLSTAAHVKGVYYSIKNSLAQPFFSHTHVGLVHTHAKLHPSNRLASSSFPAYTIASAQTLQESIAPTA